MEEAIIELLCIDYTQQDERLGINEEMEFVKR